MRKDAVYTLLVPDARPHKRTDRDVVSGDLLSRVAAINTFRLAAPTAAPGAGSPSLVSSFQGSMDELLLAFPGYGVAAPELSDGYRSLIGALRPGTRASPAARRSRTAHARAF